MFENTLKVCEKKINTVKRKKVLLKKEFIYNLNELKAQINELKKERESIIKSIKDYKEGINKTRKVK